jgi:hypothetical protein
MDFSYKNNIHKIPYWVLNFTNVKNQTPVFLEEINHKNINVNHANTYRWVNFLKTNSPLSQSKNNTLLPIINQSTFNSQKGNIVSSFSYENLININFLRYERLYTKLKYSRSPAFDIVSGGAAAIFAGFLGFLISEKFGFELVDSGDFYYLFMYVVFASFLLKPFLYTVSTNESVLSAISYKNVINFFIKILLLVLKIINRSVK